jgi:hypothetical protein
MSLSLDDARIAIWDMQDTVDGEQVKVRLYRPMTLADLVEIGEGLGGEVIQRAEREWYARGPLPDGRYLVIPLGEES